MAYTVTIEASPLRQSAEPAFAERRAADSGLATAPDVDTMQLRRLKRVVAYGPRCPDCAGPLVFGEGCQLCPVCGYSGCSGLG